MFHAIGWRPEDRKTTLIGSAYVDISALAIDTTTEANLISGYHYLYRHQTDAALGSRHSTGQLKVTVRADNNIGECKRMSMQEGKLPTLSYSPTKIPAKMRADPRFLRDTLKDSVELSMVENPFNKDATFGQLSRARVDFDEHDRLRESRFLRLSHDSVRADLAAHEHKMYVELERELEEKSRDELLQTHQRNMADLDKLFNDLQSSLHGKAAWSKEEHSVQSLIEQIDQQLQPQVSQSAEYSTFSKVQEFSQTQKTDTQRQVLQQQL